MCYTKRRLFIWRIVRGYGQTMPLEKCLLIFALCAPNALKITPFAKTIKIHSTEYGREEEIVVHLETLKSHHEVLLRTITTKCEIL